MKVSALKEHLAHIQAIQFRLPDGSFVPAHFHVTEVGLVNKHFIDCGGVERKEAIITFQLWEAEDYHHRLSPQKFLDILKLSEKIIGTEDLDVEVEYQQSTIGRFALDFDGKDFVLLARHTACLAQDACGIPAKKKISLSDLTPRSACCTPGGDCC